MLSKRASCHEFHTDKFLHKSCSLILDNNNNLMDSIVENNLLLRIDFQLKIDGENRHRLNKSRNELFVFSILVT